MLTAAEPLERLAAEKILITGASGSIGARVAGLLADAGIRCYPTDIDTLDVRSHRSFAAWPAALTPTVILHLAAAKHAPEGELDPQATVETNVTGTANMLRYAARVNARPVLASTCKAADPETVYGATKLIAERMTLNAGGSVARLFNVRESSGNVFETWAALPVDAPLPVTPCWRYFISLDAAVALVLWAAVLGPGRYTLAAGQPLYMPHVAADLYPGRAQTMLPPRRGDRAVEPAQAACERARVLGGGLVTLVSPHDPPRAPRCPGLSALPVAA
ncbi:MAG: polysaccharide biosynthesis protein [Chloroflexi bacterium]|nr:polysaccharide biosynthesis protein [Chloroflexota bacterium]